MAHRELQPEVRKNREVAARPQEIGAHLQRGGEHRRARHREAARTKCIDHEGPESISGFRKRPLLFGEVSQCNTAPPDPRTIFAGCNDILAFKQCLEVQLVSKSAGFPEYQEVETTVVQAGPMRLPAVDHDMKCHPWVTFDQPVHDGRQEAGRQGRGGPDSHLACVRVGEEFNVFDALSQLVKGGVAPVEYSAAGFGQFDPAPRPFEKLYAQGVLKITDRARDHRVRHGKLVRRPGHAAVLSDGKQDVEVAQLDTASDPVIPAHD